MALTPLRESSRLGPTNLDESNQSLQNPRCGRYAVNSEAPPRDHGSLEGSTWRFLFAFGSGVREKDREVYSTFTAVGYGWSINENPLIHHRLHRPMSRCDEQRYRQNQTGTQRPSYDGGLREFWRLLEFRCCGC